MWPFTTTYNEDQVQTLVDNAVDKALTVAASGNDDTFRARQVRESGGYDFSDELHNVYCDFGYPAKLKFSNYWNMFRRLGIAKAVVKIPPSTCWLTPPEIEASQEFVDALDALNDRINLWVRAKALDNRQRVGRYAGMFMRVRDGKEPSEELTGGLSGEASLIEMVPLYESQLKVQETQQDPKEDDFGLPTLYQFTVSEGTRNERANESFSIHPSRIVIASEEADDGGIYGFSSLEACWNSLLDIRKVLGAGAEGFYKNAAQSVIFKLTDAKAAKNNTSFLESLGETYDDFNANRGRRGLFVPGSEPFTLQSDLVQPKEFFMDALADVSAASHIPATIIIGEQTGKLASEKDNESFLTNMQSRRNNFLTEMVRDLIDWMIEFGILPSAEYDVIWDDLLATSQDEKLKNGKTMAETNETQFKAGGQIVYSEEEIREISGFDPGELPEEDDDDDEEDDDDASLIIEDDDEEEDEEEDEEDAA